MSILLTNDRCQSYSRMTDVNLTHELCGVTQNFLIIFINPSTWWWPCKAETCSTNRQIWVVTDDTFAFILYTAQSVYVWEERAAPEGHARHRNNPWQNKCYPWLELEDPGHRFKEGGPRKQHFEWSSYQPIFCGNKMPTRCNRCFLLQILLLAQHVSGTIMPIIMSSRVL